MVIILVLVTIIIHEVLLYFLRRVVSHIVLSLHVSEGTVRFSGNKIKNHDEEQNVHSQTNSKEQAFGHRCSY